MDLNSLILLEKIVETGNFSRAGLALGITKASVSNRIRQLESDLGIRLFERSTRSIRITEDGKRVRALAQPILDSAREIQAAAERTVAEPQGRIRVSAPLDLGLFIIERMVATFRVSYPSIEIEMDVSNTYVDLVNDDYDLAIRASTQPLADSSAVAVLLGETCLKFYRAPHWQCPEPQRLGNHLEEHLISYRGRDILVRSGSKTKKLKARAGVIINDMLGAKQAVLSGLGIGLLPELLCAQEVRAGHLHPVFGRWVGDTAKFYALLPSRKFVPQRTKLFLDHLKKEFFKPRQ